MYSKGIRGAFLYIPIAEISTPLHKLRNMLTAIPKYRELASIQMYDESRPGYFGIPRHLYKDSDKLFEEVIDKTIEGAKTEWYFLAKLREHQKPLFDKFQKLRGEGKTGIILNARTGFGKTVLLLKFLSEIQRTTLIIVPTVSLLTQWREMIKLHTSLTDEDIGHVQADRIDYKGKPISIGIIHSVCRDKYGSAFRNYFGNIVVDECLHPSHDILTTKGWKGIAEVTKTDKVAQYNQETREISFTHPERIIKNFFDDNLINIVGKKYDLLGTPGHEQPYFSKRKRAQSDYTLSLRRSFKDILFYKGIYVPVSGFSKKGEGLAPLDRFRIMFQADGSVISRSKVDKEECTVRWSFRKQRKINRCVSILKDCGFVYKQSVNYRGDTNIWLKVSSILATKDFSWVSITKGRIYAEEFLDELWRWDGWEHSTFSESGEHRKFFCSVNKSVVEVARILCVLCGREATESCIPRKRENHNPSYRLSWSSYERDTMGTRSFKKDNIRYKGHVYCVTVPQGNIIVRRNDKVCITGNCHRTGAEHFSKVVSMFPAKYRLLASATLKRPDGMDIVFRNHVGEATISLGSEREEEVRPRILVVRYQGASKGLPYWFKGLKVIQKRGVIISALANDANRAKELVSYTLQLAMSGRRVLVLSDRINLLKSMQASILSEHNTGLYISSTPAAEKARILRDCNILFASFGIFALGMDVPDLAGLVFATPQARIAQPVGRILRVCKGKKRPVILDMVDTDIRECVGWYHNRAREYKSSDILGEIVQV